MIVSLFAIFFLSFLQANAIGCKYSAIGNLYAPQTNSTFVVPHGYSDEAQHRKTQRFELSLFKK